MSDENAAQMEMPRYKCHKHVWALKILAIEYPSTDGGGVITPAADGYAPFAVDAAYVSKHKPQVGGDRQFAAQGSLHPDDA